jgi:hypothetical protein
MAVSRVLLHCAPRRFLTSQFITGSTSLFCGSMATSACSANDVVSTGPSDQCHQKRSAPQCAVAIVSAADVPAVEATSTDSSGLRSIFTPSSRLRTSTFARSVSPKSCAASASSARE